MRSNTTGPDGPPEASLLPQSMNPTTGASRFKRGRPFRSRVAGCRAGGRHRQQSRRCPSLLRATRATRAPSGSQLAAKTSDPARLAVGRGGREVRSQIETSPGVPQVKSLRWSGETASIRTDPWKPGGSSTRDKSQTVISPDTVTAASCRPSSRQASELIGSSCRRGGVSGSPPGTLHTRIVPSTSAAPTTSTWGWKASCSIGESLWRMGEPARQRCAMSTTYRLPLTVPPIVQRPPASQATATTATSSGRGISATGAESVGRFKSRTWIRLALGATRNRPP